MTYQDGHLDSVIFLQTFAIKETDFGQKYLTLTDTDLYLTVEDCDSLLHLVDDADLTLVLFLRLEQSLVQVIYSLHLLLVHRLEQSVTEN